MKCKKSVILNKSMISKIRENFESEQQVKRKEKNEVLDECLECINNTIGYIARGESINDDNGAQKGLIILKELCYLTDALKSMKKKLIKIDPLS